MNLQPTLANELVQIALLEEANCNELFAIFQTNYFRNNILRMKNVKQKFLNIFFLKHYYFKK